MTDSSAGGRSALLVLDVQRGIVERFGGTPELLDRLTSAIAAARAAALPVIYVAVRFRPGYPEVSARNRSFAAIRRAGSAMEETHAATETHAAVAPQPGDIVVTKRRVSAFAGSDLDVVLRSLEIDHLVLSGIATSGVVLSTLRQAADLDYQITVLADCCADTDDEVRAPRQGAGGQPGGDVVVLEQSKAGRARVGCAMTRSPAALIARAPAMSSHPRPLKITSATSWAVRRACRTPWPTPSCCRAPCASTCLPARRNWRL